MYNICSVCYASNYRTLEEHLQYRPYCIDAICDCIINTGMIPLTNGDIQYYEYMLSIATDEVEEAIRLSRSNYLYISPTVIDYYTILSQICSLQATKLKTYIYNTLYVMNKPGIYDTVLISKCVLNGDISVTIYSFDDKYHLVTTKHMTMWYPISINPTIKKILMYSYTNQSSFVSICINVEHLVDGNIRCNHYYSKYELLIQPKYISVLEQDTEVMRIYKYPKDMFMDTDICNKCLVVDYTMYPDLAVYNRIIVEYTNI